MSDTTITLRLNGDTQCHLEQSETAKMSSWNDSQYHEGWFQDLDPSPPPSEVDTVENTSVKDTSTRATSVDESYGSYSKPQVWTWTQTDEDCSSNTEHCDTREYSEEFPRPDDAPNQGEWPPCEIAAHARLSREDAEQHISKGAVELLSSIVQAPHTSHCSHRFYAAVHGEPLELKDTIPTFSYFLGRGNEATAPWATLEQPSMLTAFGTMPGTVSVTHWVTTSRSPVQYTSPPPSSTCLARQLDFHSLSHRVCQLQRKLESEPEIRRSTLYELLLSTPFEYKTLSQQEDPVGQIYDLISALNNSIYIDFSQLQNQVVAKYLQDKDSNLLNTFFSQLVLGMELHYRVQELSPQVEKELNLLANMPLTVAYTLALAETWIRNARWQPKGDPERDPIDDFFYRTGTEKMDILYDFAYILKWPDMETAEYVIRESQRNNDDIEYSLEMRCNESATWILGLALPGPITSWLLMLTLAATDLVVWNNISCLQEMDPRMGFQAPNGSYWYAECIVGKVLATMKGAKQHAGWIYIPYRTAFRTGTVFKIQQNELTHRLRRRHIMGLSRRSSPLGPKDFAYAVSDYSIPRLISESVDMTQYNNQIKFQRLVFEGASQPRRNTPLSWPAAAEFSIEETTYTFPLIYNVPFVSAPRCYYNPHPLYLGYEYVTIVAQALPQVQSWPNPLDAQMKYSDVSRPLSPLPTIPEDGVPTPVPSPTDNTYPDTTPGPTKNGLYHQHGPWCSASCQDPSSPPPTQLTPVLPPSTDRVLLVEALGCPDEEALARAWCASRGRAAVVCNLEETCVACAVRVAVGAMIGVVIVVRRDFVAEGEEEMERVAQESLEARLPAGFKEEMEALKRQFGKGGV